MIEDSAHSIRWETEKPAASVVAVHDILDPSTMGFHHDWDSLKRLIYEMVDSIGTSKEG